MKDFAKNPKVSRTIFNEITIRKKIKELAEAEHVKEGSDDDDLEALPHFSNQVFDVNYADKIEKLTKIDKIDKEMLQKFKIESSIVNS